MEETQDWIELYKELSDKISHDHSAIKMIDLWRDQPYFEETEYPLDKIAVFFSFEAANIDSLPQGVQDIPMTVRVYLYFETMADTHKGAFNQDKGLEFGLWMRKIHKSLHGFSGVHSSALTRTGFRPEPSVGGAIIYSQSFETVLRDYSAERETEEVDGEELELEVSAGAKPEDQEPLYEIE